MLDRSSSTVLDAQLALSHTRLPNVPSLRWMSYGTTLVSLAKAAARRFVACDHSSLLHLMLEAETEAAVLLSTA
jgi:hypothetical protein